MAWGTRSEMDQQRRYARTRTLLAFFGLILLVLAARLLYLQVFRYDENLRLAKEKSLVLFLSSTFLYRKETQTIINKVHQTK